MFWIFMLVMNLLIPFTMIGFGRYFMKKAPANINMLFGYRTSRSMKNMDTWVFAHKCIGKIWYRLGLTLIPVTILAMIAIYKRDIDTIGMIGGGFTLIQCFILVLTIIPVERALKKEFDEYGRKRSID